MSGFIDLLAPDPSHEYSRFLDGDVLGKMLFKNFLINRVGIQPPDFYIPRGRHGDVESPETLPADARVTVDGLPLQFEIKAGRRTTANRHRGDTNEAYSFYGFLRTRDTKYDRVWQF